MAAKLDLYVVRHAAAEDAPSGMPDAHRALTVKGREKFRKTARKLAAKVRSIDLIFTSPLVRAVQTAEILAGEVAHEAVSVLPALAGHPAQEVLDAIEGMRGDHASVALVGHEPQVTELLARSLQLPPDQAAAIQFRKGAVVLVEIGGASAAEPRWWIRGGGFHPGLPGGTDDD